VVHSQGRSAPGFRTNIINRAAPAGRRFLAQDLMKNISGTEVNRSEGRRPIRGRTADPRFHSRGEGSRWL